MLNKRKGNVFFKNSRAIFENHKETYQQEIQESINFIGQDLDFFTEFKASWILRLTRQYLGDPSNLKILDVGCGVGLTDYYLTNSFGKVYGIDLSSGIVKKASALNRKALYKHYKGRNLPYADNSMHVTFAICVLHHVDPIRLDQFVGEMIRVTKKGGLILIFEHNPLNPLTLRAVSQCDLDADAHLLRLSEVQKRLLKFGVDIEDRRYIFFTPFRGRVFSFFDKTMGWLPMGAQYLVAARK